MGSWSNLGSRGALGEVMVGLRKRRGGFRHHDAKKGGGRLSSATSSRGSEQQVQVGQTSARPLWGGFKVSGIG